MRRLASALAALALGSLAVPFVLDAARADEDAFLETAPREPLKARGAPDLPFSVQVRSTEPRLGVPTTVWVAGRPRPPRWAITPAGAALHFVEQLAPLYRLDAAARERVRVHEVHDRGEGVIIVSLHGEIDGVPLLRDELNVALDQKLRLIGLTGYLSPHLGGAASVANTFELSPRDAVQAALTRHLGAPFTDFAGAGVRDGWTRFASTREQPLGAGPSGVILGKPTRARRVLYGLTDRLEPAYHVEVTVETADRNDMVAYVVSARDGRVLSVRDLVAQHPFTYRVFVDRTGRPLDSPNGNDEIPDFSATPALPPRDWATPDLITLDHANISTMDPWMTQSSTLTSGNNVDAYYDGNSPDGLTAGDFRAETTAPDTFDWIFDPETDASASDIQRKAAIVHAFYVSNWLHDEFYDSGLDEAAGNAQRDNYGRGGVEGDDMRVEVQDYSGTNNANMATPSDGGRPRMQMYLWTGTSRTSVRELSPGATDYVSNDATFGPRDFDETADLAVATDAGGVNSLDACDPPVSSAVSGNIALIERGNCTFATKALNAQNAGAVGVIIYDDSPPNPASPPRLGGSEPAVTIGAVSVTRADGQALDAALDSGAVRVRIHRDASVQTDSAVDSMVVAHEWGHYVSNRLIGNGFGLSGNQARGMGEGWSDFHGMMLTVRADDAFVASNAGFDGTYAGATSYVSRRGPYFGIRRVPYSTDFTKNAFTFRHIQANEPLPAVPTAFGSDGRFNNRVHQTGEVWATMLWGAWSALIDSPRHSFLDAYDRMKDYLIAGYKLTPVNPTFVEARDAILLAAFAQDVDDFELIYAAFAQRGVGIGAEAPDRFSTSQTPVVESFATGAFAELGQTALTDDVRWCDREGVLDSGEQGELFIDLSNLGSTSFDDPVLEVRSLTPGLTFPNGATRQLVALPPFGGTTATVAVELAGLTEPTLGQIAVDVTDANLAFGPTQTSTIAFRVHADEVPAFSATDDVEADQTVWSASASSTFADGFTRVEDTAVQHWWFGATEPFPTEVTLTSPTLTAAAGNRFTVSFRHRFDIENGWDGGVVEISTDGGGTWEDVSVYTDPGYSGTLNNQSNNPNPLRGRSAYTGRNASFPGWDAVTLDFGTAIAGQFQLRFRIGTDWAVAAPGWSIDDIAFGGITSTPFAAVVADRGICINRPPLAQAGRDLVVPERTVATLDASGSSDPDDDALSLDWTQVDGPSATLTSTTGRFVAPEVGTDTLLTFRLRVSDAEYVSEPDFASVLVTNVNRAPTAPTIDGPTAAVERANVTLTATATDPDGDAIVRYAWEQVDGPAATLTSTGAAVRFVAPEVTETATVTLRVAASDGLLFGPATEHTVLLRSENRLPFAPEVEAKVAVEGEWVSLVARAEDPDGDPLTYTFRPLDAQLDAEQLRGPSRFRFVAPQVDADAGFRFEVRADDGFGESPPTTVVVDVVDVPEPPPEPEPDAGVPDAVGGGNIVAQDDGCGCTTTGPGEDPSPLVGFAFLAALALRRRSLRRSRNPD